MMIVEWMSTSPNECCYTLPCKMKRSLRYYITTPEHTVYARIDLQIARNCSCRQRLQQKKSLTLIVQWRKSETILKMSNADFDACSTPLANGCPNGSTAYAYLDLRELHSFRRHLKTFLFQCSFPDVIVTL